MLNNLSNNVQFTIEFNPKELAFLDILFKNQDEKIETDVVYKPADSKYYLLFICYPEETSSNVFFNLTKKICTIVSEPAKRKQRLVELKNTYPKKFLSGIIRNI